MIKVKCINNEHNSAISNVYIRNHYKLTENKVYDVIEYLKSDTYDSFYIINDVGSKIGFQVASRNFIDVSVEYRNAVIDDILT